MFGVQLRYKSGDHSGLLPSNRWPCIYDDSTELRMYFKWKIMIPLSWSKPIRTQKQIHLTKEFDIWCSLGLFYFIKAPPTPDLYVQRSGNDLVLKLGPMDCVTRQNGDFRNKIRVDKYHVTVSKNKTGELSSCGFESNQYSKSLKHLGEECFIHYLRWTTQKWNHRR